MRAALRLTMPVLALALVACAAGGMDAGPADDAPSGIGGAPGDTGRSGQRIVQDRARPPARSARDVVVTPHRPTGARLAGVTDRLYFVGTTDAPPPAERLELRAVGTEPVELLDARLIDNGASPFGLGAADHFELSLPPYRTIAPGRALGLVVRFKADTQEMQNALLTLTTSAADRPVIVVALTGKVFRAP